MLKLLIADDEKAIRETICSFIDWKSLDIDVIGTARDGIEAYNMILDQYPDIVLTDIRMPGLSGLDLIEKMHEINEDTQFIILSGYNEFEYAKTAMKYGVRHYLLKPCSEDQIINSIREIQSEYQHQLLTKNIVEEHVQMKSQMLTNMIINIINRYLAHSADAPENVIQNYFRDYRKYFDLTDAPVDVFYLYYVEDRNQADAFHQILQFWIDEYPGIHPHLLYVHNTLILFFRSFQESYPKLEQFLDSLHFSEEATSPSPQHLVFSDLMQALNKITGQIRRYESILYCSGQANIPISNSNNLLKSIQDCIQGIFKTDSSGTPAIHTLIELIEHLQNIDLLKQIAPSIIMTAVSDISAFHVVNAVDFLMGLNQLENPEEYKEALIQKILDLHQLATSTKSTGDISDRIKRYVNDHISNSELSLKWIAEHEFYMNVDYLSKKFVKETGQKFSSYLTEMRVNKAKELMSSADTDTISNIAELVGCGNNPMYFSQIFKKVTGMSPTSYLKQLHGTVSE